MAYRSNALFGSGVDGLQGGSTTLHPLASDIQAGRYVESCDFERVARHGGKRSRSKCCRRLK